MCFYKYLLIITKMFKDSEHLLSRINKNSHNCFKNMVLFFCLIFTKTILKTLFKKCFPLLKEDNRISPVSPLFWYPDFTFQNPFTKLAMFLKKPLCSPQTKINYLDSLVFYSFVLIVYILGYILLSSEPLFFTISPTVIYCAITQEFQQFM